MAGIRATRRWARLGHRGLMVGALSLLTVLMGACGGKAKEPKSRGKLTCPRDMRKIPEGDSTAAYCLDVREVSVDDFAECVGRAECSGFATGKQGDQACNREDMATQRDPINCVSYVDAQAYCRSQKKRLPTEAEWRWAAEGPASDGAGRRGSCTSAGRPLTRTCPAGKAGDKTALGVVDLHGNVSEWVKSKQNTPSRAVAMGANFTSESGSGGSWLLPRKAHHGMIGFRCAASLGGERKSELAPSAAFRFVVSSFRPPADRCTLLAGFGGLEAGSRFHCQGWCGARACC